MSYFIDSEYDESVFEEKIKGFIDNKFEEHKLNDKFPNSLIKEDVLEILDEFCEVIYYPLENERNNGFHITDVPCKGKMQNFVFINTAQTIEKQVFTAAHEIGHIWEIDKYIINELNLSNAQNQTERIVNRFAAVLLMPGDVFKQIFNNEINQYKNVDGKITIIDMFKVIISLMNCFFVPQKSVILRLVELNLIRNSTADVLLGKRNIQKELIDEVTLKLLRDCGCNKFITPSRKKWIDGLAELLDNIEKEKCIPDFKIKEMRSLFDLEKSIIPTQMGETVDI